MELWKVYKKGINLNIDWRHIKHSNVKYESRGVEPEFFILFVTIYGIIKFWLRGYVLQYTLYLTKSRRWIDPESGLIVVKAGRDPVNDEVVVV